MASTMEFAGEQIERATQGEGFQHQFYESIFRLYRWIEKNDYRAYDTFDGLSSPLLRPLTFETRFLRSVLLREYGAFL